MGSRLESNLDPWSGLTLSVFVLVLALVFAMDGLLEPLLALATAVRLVEWENLSAALLEL
jgi:membrane-associated HD superfamily phosphohydrolase